MHLHPSICTGIIAAGGLLGLFCALAGPSSAAGPAIVAHRGSSFDAPENTLASVRLGWKQNADAVEIDIHLTADQKIMVSHDGNTKRTAGVAHEIARTSSDTLRALDVGKWKSAEYTGEKMPFLKEVLATIPKGKRLYVEIKCGPEVLPFLMQEVKRYGKRDRLVFIGFGFETMRQCKADMPDIPAYWLCSAVRDSSAGPLLVSGDFRLPVGEALDTVKKAGLQGIDVAHPGIDAALVKEVFTRNLDIQAWTVDDPARARELAVLGVTGITTNRPVQIREGL